MARNIKSDGGTITVRVPISIRKRGGRKMVLAPDGTSGAARMMCRHVDYAMVKAVARAYRWRGMLDKGTHATTKGLAAAEGINESYLARILRLTLLAPDILESIVEGRQSPEITLSALMQTFPSIWPDQQTTFRRIT